MHQDTVKFLIDISPKEVILLIWNGWGELVSDKYITKHSVILRNLLLGDVILADKGFNIEESAAFYCAEVKVPAFTTDKKQLAGVGVQQKELQESEYMRTGN